MSCRPDVIDISYYLNSSGIGSWTDEEIAVALDAEAAAQAHLCTVPAGSQDWPADLGEALRRRVSRTLALRKLPLGIATSEIEATRIAGDIEVRRLEAPYRRWVVA